MSVSGLIKRVVVGPSMARMAMMQCVGLLLLVLVIAPSADAQCESNSDQSSCEGVPGCEWWTQTLSRDIGDDIVEEQCIINGGTPRCAELTGSICDLVITCDFIFSGTFQCIDCASVPCGGPPVPTCEDNKDYFECLDDDLGCGWSEGDDACVSCDDSPDACSTESPIDCGAFDVLGCEPPCIVEFTSKFSGVCREETCADFDSETCGQARNCRSLGTIEDFVCFDEESSPPCGSFLSEATCEDASFSGYCAWDPLGICYVAGGQIPCISFTKEEDCPTPRCEFDQNAGDAGVCYSPSAPLACGEYSQELACIVAPGCEYEIVSETCMPAGTTPACTDYSLSFGLCSLAPYCEYNENFQECEDCSIGDCSPPQVTCSLLSTNACEDNPQCELIEGQCGLRPCNLLSTQKASCVSNPQCQWAPGPSRCYNADEEVTCEDVTQEISCKLTDSCDFDPFLRLCHPEGFEPACTEYSSETGCNFNLPRCAWFSYLGVCDIKDKVFDCTRYLTKEGCTLGGGDACGWDDFVKKCATSDFNFPCEDYDTEDGCASVSDRCGFYESSCMVATTTTTTEEPFVDPCLGSESPCYTACITGNVSNTYSCEACPPGFSGTGLKSDGEINGRCTPIRCPSLIPDLPSFAEQEQDKCFQTNVGQTCAVKCKDGYEKIRGADYACGNDGLWSGSIECTDVKECEKYVCLAPTRCEEPEIGIVRCTDCPPGFSGSGESGCTNINECLDNNGGCDLLSDCIDDDGSFSCGDCRSGYRNANAGISNLTKCEDINECEEGVDNCDERSSCSNTIGGYLCGPCEIGYESPGSNPKQGDCKKVKCPEVPAALNKNAETECTTREFNDTCVATCKEGYRGGPVTLTCQSNKAWQGFISCNEIRCPNKLSGVGLDSIVENPFSCPDLTKGSKCGMAQLRCPAGHKVSATSKDYECGVSGQWEGGSFGCEPCEPGTFQDKATSSMTCKPALERCSRGTREFAPATTTTDRVCVTECTIEEFELAPATAVSDTICKSYTSCLKGQYESKAPSGEADRECLRCPTCTVGNTYVNGECDGSALSAQFVNNLAALCVPCPGCNQGFYLSKLCNTVDRTSTCSPITTCSVGQRVLRAPTTTTDRVCGSVPQDVTQAPLGRAWLKGFLKLTYDADRSLDPQDPKLLATLSQAIEDTIGGYQNILVSILSVGIDSASRRRLLAEQGLKVEYFADALVPQGLSSEDVQNDMAEDLSDTDRLSRAVTAAALGNNFTPLRSASVIEAGPSEDSGVATTEASTGSKSDGLSTTTIIIIAAAVGVVLLVSVIGCYCFNKIRGETLMLAPAKESKPLDSAFMNPNFGDSPIDIVVDETSFQTSSPITESSTDGTIIQNSSSGFDTSA